MDIVQHALNNIWSNPSSSHDNVISLKRISRPTGVRNQFKLVMSLVDTPTNDIYHIYQVGQLHPADLGIKEDASYLGGNSPWRSLKDVINLDQVYISVYTDTGLMLPFAWTFITFTENRDMLVAVRNDFRVEIDGEVFLRSRRGPGAVICSSLDYSDVSKNAALTSMFVNTSESSMIFRNGRYIHDKSQVKLNDLIEVINDGNIDKVYTCKVSDLDSFSSTLDAKLKYFIQDLYANGIWHSEDADVYVYYADASNPSWMYGRYCAQNSDSTLRNVTPESFSLSTVSVGEVTTTIVKELYSVVKDISDLMYVKLLLRSTLGTKVSVSGSSRLKDLSRIPKLDLNRTMIGSEASLDIWHVDKLESSPYSKLMTSAYKDVNSDTVADAYGYNNVCTVLTPYVVDVNGATTVAVPAYMQGNSTLYMYDVNGKFISEALITIQTTVTLPTGVHVVEFVPGHANNEVSVVGVDTVQLPLDVTTEYKVYGLLHGRTEWIDVTTMEDKFTISDNRLLTWNDVNTINHLIVRTSKTHLLHKFSLDADSGNYEFTLSEFRTPAGQVRQNVVLEVPFGDLDIWLNGRCLVDGLDYVVDFPRVVITNVNYLVTGTQDIVYRFTGFCDAEFKFNALQERGWTYHGLVGANNRVDLHGDRIETLSIDGGYQKLASFYFRDTWVSGTPYPSTVSGLPYCIKQRVVPLNGMCTKSTTELLTESLAVDKKLTDFLNLRYPVTDTALGVIVGKYRVVSPIIARVIFYLKQDLIPPALLTDYSPKALEDYLISSDGFFSNFEPSIDTDYAIKVPHRDAVALNVTPAEYRIIKGVSDLYNLGIDMSINFTVTP